MIDKLVGHLVGVHFFIKDIAVVWVSLFGWNSWIFFHYKLLLRQFQRWISDGRFFHWAWEPFSYILFFVLGRGMRFPLSYKDVGNFQSPNWRLASFLYFKNSILSFSLRKFCHLNMRRPFELWKRFGLFLWSHLNNSK